MRGGLLLLAALAGPCGAAETLTLHYQERPPFSSRGPDGQPQGLLVTPVAQAMARAGISYRWARTPSQRQLALIQRGDGLDCGLGWFRTPEREALGRFSGPIYRDQSLQALVRRDSPIEAGRDLADLLADPALPPLVKQGYSYGPTLDSLLLARSAPVVSTSAESTSMARMIVAGRAAWMPISPEEAGVLLAGLDPQQAPLRLAVLGGVDPGATRHLYCSRRVDAALVERIDHALATP
jgi:polar amino acid transport system substrate-binding protein